MLYWGRSLLAFGLIVCRPHSEFPKSFFRMPPICSSFSHVVLPFQTKNAGAPHSPHSHLHAHHNFPCCKAEQFHLRMPSQSKH